MKGIINVSDIQRSLTIKLDTEKNMLIVNEQPIKCDVKLFANRLQTIISLWDKVMIDDSVSDGEHYSVKIKYDDNIVEYLGANKFPSNYRDFITLINEVAKW